jgi:signal transduction histidine kinase
MPATSVTTTAIDKGTLTFSIESRIIRELGERLVKQPEVAVVELIKNAYDADATKCSVTYDPSGEVSVIDDGHGMTLDAFKTSWMRIGTSAKEGRLSSPRFGRRITGEKGIGRFAVRFLGRILTLETVAHDATRGFRTLLTATFNWETFDRNEDLGRVTVPYELYRAEPQRSPGTALSVTELRESGRTINLQRVRTASISIVNPFRPLMRDNSPFRGRAATGDTQATEPDPGFSLALNPSIDETNPDVAAAVLQRAVLRSVLQLEKGRLRLRIYRRDASEPSLEVDDRYPNSIGSLYADIRFFPQRKGTFSEMPVDGRTAREWVKRTAGVAVFDRSFRVLPYGTEGDDWLRLAADAAKRERDPKSSIAGKHFPMDETTKSSTQLNYMLKLPHPEQLVGVVQVEGLRSADETDTGKGLIAAADREGFIANAAYVQLFDLVRGAVEAIAYSDRELTQELEKQEQRTVLRSLRAESRAAIREVEANPNIRRGDKARIVKQLADAYTLAEQHEARAREREGTLEIMSLLGVVAGFMTHEFGAAVSELERAQTRLTALSGRDAAFRSAAEAIGKHITHLRDFVTYSQGYVQGTSQRPSAPYPAKPRVKQVVRIFGKYAADRGIQIDVDIDSDLIAALVPVSLYNGVALNLFTNALKAVTARAGAREKRIAFRAWNENVWHFFEVSDTGIGISPALRTRVFDPLFTTTSTNRDPLGSGMGLGLPLVRRGVEAYGGRVDVVDPPHGFITSVRVRLPLNGGAE